MPRDRDDKRERDWRQVDRNKDRSKHRQEERPQVSKHKQARADSASKVYRSNLDAFFDGDGKAPAHIAQKLAALDTNPPGGKERVAALKKIKDSGTASVADRAVEAYLEQWELPPDHDVLAGVLLCSDEDHVRTALEMISELLTGNRPPRRSTVLQQRLKRIVSLGEEPDVQDRARGVIRQLRLFS